MRLRPVVVLCAVLCASLVLQAHARSVEDDEFELVELGSQRRQPSSSSSESSSSSGSTPYSSSSFSSGSSSSGSSSGSSSSSSGSSGSSGYSSSTYSSSVGSSNPPPVPPASRSESGPSEKSSSRSSSGSSGEDELTQELIKNMHMVARDDDSSKDQELADALQSVKDNIVFQANNIKQEKRWVREVTKIIETYVKKARRVNANIREMQQQVKVLFRKKKQIENMIVQRKLEKKIKVARKDLDTINAALANVFKKQSAFNKSKSDIKATIGAMRNELAKLRGVSGESSSSSSESSSENSSI